MQTLENDVQYYEVKGLHRNTRYAFWVTATSAIGEGPMSTVVTQLSAGKDVPAMSASFDDVIKSHSKRDLVMPCRAVGIPAPERKWFQRGRVVKENENVVIRFDGTLVIKKPTGEDSGNYTCRIINKHGTDEVHYSVNVVVPPGIPSLDVLSKSLTSVRLRWQPGTDGGDPIKGYFLHFKRDSGHWDKKELPADTTTYTLDGLACGSTYQLYVEAFNNVGVSAPCDVVAVTTHGETFQLPSKETLIQEGSTFVTVHLDAWPSTGCPVQSFTMEYKQLSSSDWTVVSTSIKPTQKKRVIQGLLPATWYVLRMTAYTSGDDFNIGEYIFTTLTIGGEPISPDVIRPEERVIMYLDPWIFIPVVTLIIVCIITSVVVFVYCKRNSPRRKQPADWTEYAGTLARAHELGVSVESFVRLPKGGPTATLSRQHGTIWRRGDEPNPYATIRLPDCYSEMTLVRDGRGLGSSRMPQQIPMIRTEAGWIPVESHAAMNPFEQAQMWPEPTYGQTATCEPVYGIQGTVNLPNRTRTRKRTPRQNAAAAVAPPPSQETTFSLAENMSEPNKQETAVTAAEVHPPTEEQVKEHDRKDGDTSGRKDVESGEEAWLLAKGDTLK